MRITAIIATRNEWPYLSFLLRYLEREGVEVIVLNNDSEDETADQLDSGEFRNVRKIIRIPYNGYYDHWSMLEIKMREASLIDEGWIIHHDSDEIMHSPDRFGGLRDEIESAEKNGFNAINLQEIVMLPVDPEIDDHIYNNLNYYYFNPNPVRLLRIWKAELPGTILRSGGHLFEGDNVTISNRDLILRHYIVRSQQHAFKKYVDRKFAAAEIERGWHWNRIGLGKVVLQLPLKHPLLKAIDAFDSNDIDLSESTDKHYWQWDTKGETD